MLVVSDYEKNQSLVPPKDRYNLAYVFLLLHGIGFLLPWNVFINANDYFKNYKLNTTTSQNSDYRVNFLSYIGICAQLPNLIMGAWSTFYQTKGSASNPALRFVIIMCIEIALLFITVVMIFIDTSKVPVVFFAITMLTVVLINCCVGIHQTITFGIAAFLPMRYSNAVIMGCNICGTIISTLNIITKSVSKVATNSDQSVVLATTLYFALATLFLIACIITYFWLQRLDFVRYYLDLAESDAPAGTGGDVGWSKNCFEEAGEIDEETVSQKKYLKAHDEKASELMDAGDAVTVINGDPSPRYKCFSICCLTVAGKSKCKQYWGRYVDTFKECWVQCLNVWMVFVCTLSVFPAVQVTIAPISSDYFISKTWFTDVTCFLFFNLFAVVGCIVSSYVKYPGPRFLSIPIVVRFLFIPFFMLSNYKMQEVRKLPLIVNNDHAYVFGSIVFAFSNGYLSSLTMMYAPRNSPPERAGLAGLLASFFLIFGVFCGVYISRGILSIL